MNYENMSKATFISRPNRFIALCRTDGETLTCHVKNTGRCRELLVPGATVWLQHLPSSTRKTAYDLICVEKNGMLINMDSAAPNKVVLEALRADSFPLAQLHGLNFVRGEYPFGSSRLDFYAKREETIILGEVKGVTLEENGVVLFPDAPTERGLKHIHELINAAKQGYEAYLIFIIQLMQARRFLPNDRTQPQFGQALKEAKKEGVRLHAFCCHVTPTSLTLSHEVPILLPK